MVVEDHREYLEKLNALKSKFLGGLGSRRRDLEAGLDRILFDHSKEESLEGLKEIRLQAHNLAGAAGTYGFVELSRQSKEIETLCDCLIDDDRLPDRSDRDAIRRFLYAISNVRSMDTSLSLAKMSAWEPHPGHLDRRKLLLVEDDADFSGLLTESLKPYGYDLVTVESPKMLAEAIKENNFSALLMDVMFEGNEVAGVDEAVRLRKNGLLDLPLIFLSVRGDIISRLGAVRANCDAYLVKPFDTRELVDQVDRLVVDPGIDRFRVLTVDDDPAIAEYYKIQFEAQGMRCQTVTEPLHIMAALRSFKPDVILLDVMMPDCSGFELAAIIRQYPLYTETPIVFLTSASGTVLQVSGIESGGDDFVPKSTEFEALVKIVRSRAKRSRELGKVIGRLKRSEERFQKSLTFSNIGIWDWTIPTGRLLWSDQMPALFGYPNGELETNYENFINSVHPEDRKMVEDAIADCVERRQEYVVEHRIVWPDGTVRWLLERGDVIRDSDGQAIQMLGVVQDISERKAFEANLELATKLAEAANRAKSEFLATMSHEIRTPINGVVGMIELLQGTKLNADQQRMVEVINGSSHSLLALVNNVLDFTKIDAGHLDVVLEPVDPAEIAESVCDTLWKTACDLGVRLNLDTDPQMPCAVLSDGQRLRQVLINLVGNAVKFSKSEGKDGDVRLIQRLETDPDGSRFLKFSIIDNGIGMKSEQIAELFEPFTQADASTTRRFGGTGLGLAITKLVTDALNGTIEVRSVPDQGTTVEVSLPCEVATEPPVQAVDLTGIDVLLVMDGHGASEIAAAHLKARGALPYHVSTLSDLDQALKVGPDKQRFYQTAVLGPDLSKDFQTEVIERLRANPEIVAPRFVILYSELLAPEGVFDPSTVLLGAHPIKPRQLIQGVAAAAGIADLSNSGIDLRDPGTAERAARSLDRAGKRILVVEDNEINLMVFCQQLEKLGYVFDTAIDGGEALNAWQNSKYALVLSDCHMPVMDGYELTRRIRQIERELETGEHTPIVAVTADVQPGASEVCFAAGMDGYIAKPVKMDQLKQVLEKWLPSNDEVVPTVPPTGLLGDN